MKKGYVKRHMPLSFIADKQLRRDSFAKFRVGCREELLNIVVSKIGGCLERLAATKKSSMKAFSHTRRAPLKAVFCVNTIAVELPSTQLMLFRICLG